jgi:hypothetical protein
MTNKPEVEFVSLRCPRPIKEWVEREAAANFRSANSQVLAVLKERMEAQAQRADKAKAEDEAVR